MVSKAQVVPHDDCLRLSTQPWTGQRAVVNMISGERIPINSAKPFVDLVFEDCGLATLGQLQTPPNMKRYMPA